MFCYFVKYIFRIPEQVSSRLIPVVHAELQRALHEQKVFIDTALQASQVRININDDLIRI